MSRKLAVLFLCAVSGAAAAQMMGGPMMTTNYFPLVDGAHYEYMFASGPHSTATAVMHGGQQWAGTMGLTSVHMTLTCRDATPCDPDRMDFYGMGPDGMHYFGGSAETPDGTHYMMSLTSPEWMLKNPVAPGTMMGPGMGYQNAEMWQAGVAGMNTMMGAQSYLSSYQALALETVVTPAGTFPNALHVHERRGNGYERDVWYAADVGMVRWMDNQEEALLTTVYQGDERGAEGRVRGRVLPRGSRPLLHHGGPERDEFARHGPLHRLATHRHGLQRVRPDRRHADVVGRLSPLWKSGVRPGHAFLLRVYRRVCRHPAQLAGAVDARVVERVPHGTAGHDERRVPGRNDVGIPHLEPACRQQSSLHHRPRRPNGHDESRRHGGGLRQPAGGDVLAAMTSPGV